MLFNSYVFLFLFLPLTLLAWWLPRRIETRLFLLVAASYIFYGWWDWRFCALMFAVTCTDYFAASRIARAEHPERRKWWLIATLTVNLGLLAYFKYAGFFTDALREPAEAIGLGNYVPVLSILLPLGISFYIFESLSYTIDIYRGIAKPAKSFLHYMLFIAIFPKLIAGPIIRYTDVEEQYASLPKKIDVILMWSGVLFFVVGLAKKVLIADKAAALAAPYLGIVQPNLFESWVAVGAYTFQIYFDFSGYSDMAVGLGMMLGFRFPQNFNRPYLATSISEFWERWHITLSRWLRDYLFIPLGGSRGGTLFTMRNLVIVMFLGGLWHGANWTFVVWGLYHGALLVAYHMWHRLVGARGWSLPLWPARAVTLLAVMVGWALFVSPDITQAGNLIQGMFGMNGVGTLEPPSRVAGGDLEGVDPRLRQVTYLASLALAMGVGALWILLIPEVWEWRMRIAPARRHAIGTAAVAIVCIGALAGFSPFIYYQF